MAAAHRLLTPGPTPLPESVQHAAGQPMIHHRGTAYRELLHAVTEGLKAVFQTEHEVLVLTSSGTGGLEAALVNTVSPGERLLAASAGSFGDRWADIAKAFGAEVDCLRFADGQAVDLNAIKKALAEGAPYKALLFTHNETSTGVMNDLAALGGIIQGLPPERRPLLMVDAISSLGALELRADDWGCDIVVTASQKALMSPPGVAAVSVSPRAWEAAAQARMPRYYWDFRAARQRAKEGISPFTPAVTTLYGLRVALDLILEEGLYNVFARHRRLALRTRKGIQRLSLHLFPNEAVASDTVTAVRMPPVMNVDTLLTRLRDDFGIILTGVQGPLKGRIFRIGHMGCVSEADVDAVLEALAHVLHSDQ